MRRVSFSWPVAGLVLLALITVALALVALQGPGAPPGGAPQPTGSALTDPPQVSSTPTAKPLDRRAPDVEPLLSLVDSSNAYRGTPGACAGGATLERTENGGRRWSTSELPGPALLSLTAATSVVVEAVLADETCEAGGWSTSNAGRTWNGPNPTSGSWFRLAETTRKLATPVGPVPNPCADPQEAVVELDALTTTAAFVLCPDGRVTGTNDGGQQWTKAAASPGAVALAWDSPELGWVLVEDGPTCPLLQARRTVDGGLTWQDGGCIGTADSSGARVRPALEFVDPLAGMAWLGDETFVTADGGITWRLA